MSDIDMADVTLHIDENLDQASRERLWNRIRSMDGVVAVAAHDDKPHLAIIEYNPDKVSSQDILACAREEGVHAELIGL